MSNAANMQLNKLKILLTGKPKVGKTNLVGTYSGNVYVFDTDDGLATLRGKGNVWYDTFIDLDARKPTAYLNAEKQLEQFAQGVAKTGKVIYKDGDKEIPIDMVVLDGSTEFLGLAMNTVLFANGRAGSVPQQNDYLPQMFAYSRFIDKLKALPCHVVVICHEEGEKDEITGAITMMPALTGKLAGRIGGKFDIIFRCECLRKGSVVEYRVLTQNNGAFTAGTRFGDALEMYEVPNLDMLMKKIETKNQKKPN